MFIIGEKINGMFKSVREALVSKNKAVIQDLAQRQIDGGAKALDVNVGPASAEPIKDMEWLINTVREVSSVPLAIDTTKADVMEKGLQLAGPGSFINSVDGREERIKIYFPLAKKYNARLIALTMNKAGVPANAESRMEIAAQLVAAAMEHEIEMSSLYIDSVILPVNVAQDHVRAVLETIRQCKVISDPAPNTILGLSNVSQGTLYRSLVDRTFLIMALAAGLDAAIVNPLDNDLADAMITAELLLGRNIYCESFLDAYRKN